MTTCVGRQIMSMDKLWSTAIIRERQCGAEITEGDLCKTCAKRSEKYEGKAGAWLGRITEEPFDWCHMLGTAWAEKKKPVFNADAVSSENASVQEMETEVSKKPGRKPKMTEEEKEAEKAKKVAEKEAKKAEKAEKAETSDEA